MADLTASQKIEVQALWDGTQLKRGSEEAERSIEDLARVFDTETDQIRRSLDDMDRATQDTLGSGGSLDRAAPDLQAQGSRTAEIGSEIGQEFGQNMSEGFSSGDIAGTVADTFAALSGAAGVAGIGVLVGATLVKGMITGANEKKQEFIDDVDSLFTSIEVRAGEAQAKIRRKMVNAFDFQTALEKISGGTAQEGYKELLKISEEVGVPWQKLLELFRKGITPATKATYDILKDQATATLDGATALGRSRQLEKEKGTAAGEFLETVKLQNSELRTAATLGKANADYLFAIARDGNMSADAMERYAAAAERAQAAINNTNPWPPVPDPRGGG